MSAHLPTGSCGYPATTKHTDYINVHGHQHRPFAFLAEQFGMRLARARGDAPVDGANIVTGLVVAHFLEVDPAAAKVRLVGPGEITQRAFAPRQLQLRGGEAQGDERVQLGVGALGRL